MSSNDDNNPSSPSSTSPSILSLNELKINLPSNVYNHLARQYEGLYHPSFSQPKNDDGSPSKEACQHLNQILQQLKYSPSYTCCRINYIKRERREDVLEELKQHFLKENWIVVEPHALFRDVILIRPSSSSSSSPHVKQSIFTMRGPPPSSSQIQKRTTWPVYTTQKIIIVDRYCGEAILRGSNIYVRGVLSADSNISKDDNVAIYAHLSSLKIPRGLLVKQYTEKCVFVGMGVTQCSRREMLTLDRGLAVQMSNNAILPSMNGVLEDKMLMQNLPSVLVAHALLSDILTHPLKKREEEEKEVKKKKIKKEKLVIMDMCCAPGGKTSHMASLLHGHHEDYIIVACDKSRSKMKKTRELFQRMGMSLSSMIVPLALDSTKGVIENENAPCKEWKSVEEIIAQASPSKKDGLLNIKSFHPQSYDCILLDPPCSALGLRPKLMIDDVVTNVHDLVKHAEYQRKFVANAVLLLKCGGVMTYSTCTIHVAENEKMVRYILDTYDCMTLMPISFGGSTMEGIDDVGGFGLPGLPNVGLSEEERLMVRRFDPSDEKTDTMGFFVAKFRKK